MAIKHFAVGCAAILTAAGAMAATSNFTVNGQTITKAQQEELIRVYTSRGQERTPQLETQVRHLLTRDALLLQEARKAKISERDDVQRMIDNATKNILMSTVINDWLAKNPVKEEEVKALFEKEQKRWGKTEVSVRHILVEDETTAKDLLARVKKGGDFDRTAVLAVLEQNAQRGVTVRYTPQHQAARAAEQTAAIPEYLHAGKGRLQGEKTGKIDPRQDSVQRLVDIEQKMAEGKGKGYERWAKIHNLKQAAKTLTIYQQYGFSSPEQLEAAVATAYQEMRQTSGELKALETKLQGKRELRQQVLAYAKTKPIREGLKAQKSEKARAAYRQANESDFIIAEAAARYFKAQGLTKLPGRKALQAEIEQLISEKDGLYNTYHEQKQRFRELQTVKRNIDQILRREEPHRRKEQSHER